MQPANIWPDLLITVNFTTLGINATSLSNYGSRTVLIVVGMHNDTADVLRNTLPIPLVPDAHLLGGVLTTIRYQYSSPKFASLGAFSSVRPSVHIFLKFHPHPHYCTLDKEVPDKYCPIPNA